MASALRVDGDEVLEILDTTLSAASVEPFIEIAHQIVEDNLLNCGYGDDTLAKIELLLSCHFASIRDPMITQEKTGEGETRYHGKSAMGLDHTPWGQQVKLLDSCGILASLDSSTQKAELKVVG